MKQNNILIEKMQAELEVWLTLDEVMTLLYVSRRTVDKYCSTGMLPFAKVGRKRFFLNADLRSLIASNYNGKRYEADDKKQQKKQKGGEA